MSEDRKQFNVWLNSEMTKHKDNVDMLNYYRRNEEYLRDGFINGAKIKDAEIAELNKTLAYHSEKLTAVTRRHCDELDRNCELKKKLLRAGEIVSEKCKEIERLNAKVAMMRGLLNEVIDANDYLNSNWFDARQALFAATEADVQRWVNCVRAEVLEEIAPQTSNYGDCVFIQRKAKELRDE